MFRWNKIKNISESLFEQLFNHLPDYIFILNNKNNKVDFVNSNLLQLLNKRSGSFSDVDISKFFSEKESSLFLSYKNATLHPPLPMVEIITKAGVLSLELNTTLYNANNDSFTIFALRDISFHIEERDYLLDNKREYHLLNEQLLAKNERFKQLNIELESNQAYLNSIFKSAPIALGIIQQEKLIYVNDLLCKIVDFSKSELIGNDFASIFDTLDEYQNAMEVLYEGIKSTGVGMFEAVWKTKKSKKQDVLIHASLLFPDRKDSGISISAIDITESRKDKDAIIQREQEFALLFSKMTSGIALIEKSSVDSNYHFININSAFEKIINKTKEEVIYYDIQDVFKEIDNFWFQEILNNSEEKNSLKIEFFFQSWNKYIEISAYHPKSNQIAIIFNDITQRKIAEDILKISEERLKLALEASNDGLWDLNTQSKQVFLSPRWFTMLGYNPEDFTNSFETWTSLIHLDDQELFLERFNSLINSKDNILHFEYRIKAQNNVWRWILSKGKAVEFNEKGKITRVVGTNTDITEQKIYEQELIKSRKKAEESDKLKSAFLANMSHEIRTPMNGILGFSQLLDNEHLDAESRKKYISIINSSTEYLLAIISDIIDLSKLEAGQLTIAETTVNINVILEELQEIIQSEKLRMGKDHLQIIFQNPQNDKDLLIITDHVRVRQILINLLTNALKFTDTGTITCGYNIKHTNSPTIEFYVTDTGIGIPEDKQKIIFERFRQLEYGQNRKYGGTGLGLSICRGLIKLLNGEISLTSQEGGPTTFFVSIPLKASSMKDKPQLHLNLSDTECARICHEKTILIVEDEAINFELLKEFLSNYNVNIIWTKTGEETLRYDFVGSKPDVILMDIRLPDANGLELTTILKHRYPTIPIIAQTANAQESDKIKCLEAGCDDYLPKPINKDRFFEALSRILR